ncbi:MAG: Hpt domain-containing protein [Phycisphaerales bacterium]
MDGAGREQTAGSLRSKYADDPDMAELIEEFAASMPERVSAIVAGAASGDLAGLIHASHQLKGAGGGYGFAPVSEVAGALESALRALSSPAELERVRRQIDDLVEICQRVRA